MFSSLNKNIILHYYRYIFSLRKQTLPNPLHGGSLLIRQREGMVGRLGQLRVHLLSQATLSCVQCGVLIFILKLC